MKLENATLDDLWEAWKIISSKDKTTIVDWKWDKKEIEFRVEQIKNAIENSSSDFSKKDLEKRLAKLAWGVAVIKVWAVSEVEMKELKLRIEDALNATRAAVEEGIVAWWWTWLLRASKVLDNLEINSAEEELAKSILKEALIAPIRKIAENAWKDAWVIINKIEENSSINFWYDASKDEFVDMIEAWIIDPKKVERVALQEAISLAGMFLTTEAAISEIAKKEESSCPDGNCWVPQIPMM
jgi:chaperonin GroEL